MRNRKVKIPQYLVRGKSRTYSVLVFPKKPWLWSFYEDFDECYEVDGDPAAYQQIKYALAAIIANSGKIAYFPIRDKGCGIFYQENYDAVFVRPELQLRQSEWVSLRRQLDGAHRIKSFELYYEPEKLYNHYAALRDSESEMAKIWHRDDYRSVKLLGDTVFFSLRRETCYGYHYGIINGEQAVQEGYHYCFAYCFGELGYLITPDCKRDMRRDNEKWYKKQRDG